MMCLIRGDFLKISVRELHRQLQFMGDADCQKRYGLAWGLQRTDPDQYPYTHTPDGLGKDKNKIVKSTHHYAFCIALINLAL